MSFKLFATKVPPGCLTTAWERRHTTPIKIGAIAFLQVAPSESAKGGKVMVCAGASARSEEDLKTNRLV
jgi:hypothetical protein